MADTLTADIVMAIVFSRPQAMPHKKSYGSQKARACAHVRACADASVLAGRGPEDTRARQEQYTILFVLFLLRTF